MSNYAHCVLKEYFSHSLGELPLIQNLNNLPAGTYVFNVSATDIYRLRDNFVIEYTSKYQIAQKCWIDKIITVHVLISYLEEPLKLSLINSSPRIWAGQIIADFTVNRERGQFTATCDLGRQKQKNCKLIYRNCVKYSDQVLFNNNRYKWSRELWLCPKRHLHTQNNCQIWEWR